MYSVGIVVIKILSPSPNRAETKKPCCVTSSLETLPYREKMSSSPGEERELTV